MPNLKLIDVEIDRGRDVITVAVPAHEVRVLKAVHGIDKVREAAVQEGDEAEFADSASAEYDRLDRKYRRVNAPNAVAIAFPMGAEQLIDHGFKPGVAGEAEPQSLIKKHKQPKKADKK